MQEMLKRAEPAAIPRPEVVPEHVRYIKLGPAVHGQAIASRRANCISEALTSRTSSASPGHGTRRSNIWSTRSAGAPAAANPPLRLDAGGRLSSMPSIVPARQHHDWQLASADLARVAATDPVEKAMFVVCSQIANRAGLRDHRLLGCGPAGRALLDRSLPGCRWNGTAKGRLR
jgi:hypothetical protein